LLVEHFVQKFARQQSKSIDHIPDESVDALKRHDWPGNIRELQNVIERAVIMTTGPVLALPLKDQAMRIERPAMAGTLADAERAHILATLRGTDWVVGGPRGAAAQLGLARTTLLSIMQRLGIAREACAHRAREQDASFVSTPLWNSDASRQIREKDKVDEQTYYFFSDQTAALARSEQ
jgi:formate hydrogenlyase transcriptional activator